MKVLLVLLGLFFTSTSFANIDLDKELGACKQEFESALVDSKNDFLTSTVWNYDNDYSIDEVTQSDPYNFTSNGDFSVDIFFNIQGLEDFSFTYIFTPVFLNADKSQCDYVNVSEPIINL